MYAVNDEFSIVSNSIREEEVEYKESPCSYSSLNLTSR